MKRHSQHKVPLNTDRDHITPSYLRALHLAVLKARVVRQRKEDASDPEGTKSAVAEEQSSPTAVISLNRTNADTVGIKNKITRREKHLEGAMKNLKTHLAVLSLSALCLLNSAYGQVRRERPAAFSQSSQGQSLSAAPLIVEPIDESKRIVLPGSTRGEVRPEFDRGPVDDLFPLNGIQLQLRRPPEREQVAEALADELQRKGSARFHQWLTADQYGEQFGLAPEDIAKISEWLRAHGFTVNASPSQMTIDFSGTASQVREAFRTEIHALDVKGERHIANVGNPSIPAALAPAIEGIVSLNDFRPRPTVVPRPQYTFPLHGVITGTEFYAVVPADLATIYNFNPLFSAGITGQGQTIALIEDSDVYNPNDWTTFRKTFGLNVYRGASFTTVHPGGCSDPGVNADGDDIEAILDVEWASAAAPSANLQLASCASTTTVWGGLIAIQNVLNQRQVPPIISMSYLNCEAQNGAASNAAYKALYLQAVLEGVSVFAAAGDNGSALCDYPGDGLGPTAISGVAVSGLASTAYNVAVGGTDFGDTYAGTAINYWSSTNGPNYNSALRYVPEIPWNDTCASTLISGYLGYATPYGADGFCASTLGANFLALWAGSGGPSNCATGVSITESNGATPSNGTCEGWEKPSWQNVIGNPQDGVRDLPDVSLFAADGVWNHAYVICDSDVANYGAPCVGAPSNWTLGGGTSFGTPIMAGMQALVNEVWGSPQGNPAPVYYALARQEYGTHGNKSCQSFVTGGPASTCTFYDVTVGDNDVDCTGPYNCFDPGASAGVPGVLSLSDNSYQPAFTAGAGWDFATGIGSVNATNLVLNPIWLEGWLP
ncbi:MAG: S53 family peptidase [Candidatus Sulfotelmatobacter sp.]